MDILAPEEKLPDSDEPFSPLSMGGQDGDLWQAVKGALRVGSIFSATTCTSLVGIQAFRKSPVTTLLEQMNHPITFGKEIFTGNYFTQVGKRREPECIRHYVFTHHPEEEITLSRPDMICAKDFQTGLRLVASLDAVVSTKRHDFILEVKTWQKKRRLPQTFDEIPLEYVAQVFFQMFVSGYDTARLFMTTLDFGQPGDMPFSCWEFRLNEVPSLLHRPFDKLVKAAKIIEQYRDGEITAEQAESNAFLLYRDRRKLRERVTLEDFTRYVWICRTSRHISYEFNQLHHFNH